jgi:hypothetical protein
VFAPNGRRYRRHVILIGSNIRQGGSEDSRHCCLRALNLPTLPGESYPSRSKSPGDKIADERLDFGGLEWLDDGTNVGAPVLESEIQRIARRNDDG